MTTSEEPMRFGAALHEAVTGLEPPNPDSLYADALAWKRRTRRRRSIGAGLVAAVAVAAAGATAASVVGTGQGTAPTTPTPTSTSLVYPDPGASSAWAGQGLGKYMAQSLWSLVPKGAKPYSGNWTGWLSGSGYVIMSSWGDWQADGEVQLTYHGQNMLLQLVVRHGGAKDGDFGSPRSCAEATAPPNPHAPCTSKALGEGTLVIDDEFDTAPAVPPTYYWELGNDLQIQFGVSSESKAGATALTEQQIESIISSPVWVPVLETAPAIVNCGGLHPVGAVPPFKYWECPTTGKEYPISSTADMYSVKTH